LLTSGKEERLIIDADYVGFLIPDEFIVGYGLDYNQAYRNIPYIGVLDKEVYSDAHILTAKRSENI
jgi:hypoxanthine phosphoribosyltransferase